MKRIFVIILPLLICLVPMLAWGETYYVSEGATGSWTDATNRSTPTSFKRANANAAAGDIVIFINDGGHWIDIDWGGVIMPDNSGSPGNPITFKGEPGTEVIINGRGYGAKLDNRSYITVENFKFTNAAGTSWIGIRNKGAGTTSSHIIIQNNTFEATTYTWAGIYADGNVDNLSILNNTIKAGVGVSGGHGDAIMIVPVTGYTITNVLIEGNDIEGGCHNALDIQTAGGTLDHVVVRNNKIHNPNHTSLSIYGSSGTRPQYVLIENNEIYDGGSICGLNSCPDNICGSSEDRSRPREQHPNIQFSGNNNTIRNNVVYNGGWAFVVQNTANNNRVYNNVFYNNVQGGNFNTGENVDSNVFKNNVFKDNVVESSISNSPLVVDSLTGDNCTNEWAYNNFDEDNNISYVACNNIYGEKTLSFLETNIPAIFHNNMEVGAGFVDAPNYNFNLTSSSSLIDKGGFLTYTNGSGNNSNTIIVDDVRYFTDGWGIVNGDIIQLKGQSTTVRIINVDYSTNTITVDQNISWYDNQGVSLPYNGSSPDMGAHESSYTSVVPSPPTNLTSK